MEGRISGKTKLYALIGSPVGHSGSPAMYNYSFAAKGIDSVYVAFDVDVEHTKDAIAAMKTFDMGGMNVTMPCKVEAAKYMDELSDAARIMANHAANARSKIVCASSIRYANRTIPQAIPSASSAPVGNASNTELYQRRSFQQYRTEQPMPQSRDRAEYRRNSFVRKTPPLSKQGTQKPRRYFNP